jgi:O-antigen/teichoic acid export membrane protein
VTDGQVLETVTGDQEVAAGPPDPRAGSLGHHAGRGLRWALVGNVVLKAGSFVMSLVMVRLLAPHDFGLYAVALASQAFLIHVNDMGMIAATVQWRGRLDEMTATATTMALGFSLAWYGLFWVAAPVLADAASSPDATPLVRLLTFTIVIDGITAVSVGVIQRRFQQDKLMRAIAVGFVGSAAVTLSLALSGAGAYSFVFGALTQSLLVAVQVLRIARVPFRLGFDRSVARRLLIFGIPLALGLGVESVVLYSDSMIVGHVLGTATLGLYLLAFNVSSWVPGIVGGAVRYVSIPAFSRLAEGDEEAFSHGVQRALPLLVTFVAPIAAALTVLSPALIHVLYGEHWVPAAQALRFLAFVMVARMFTALVFDVQTGLGNTQVPVRLNLVWLVALLPALWFGTNIDGIRGAAIGHAVVALVVAIPVAGWMLHRAGVDMRPVLRRSTRPVLAAVVAGLVMAAVAVPLHSPIAQLLIAGGLGSAAYLPLALSGEDRAAARQLLPRLPRHRGATA